MRLAAPPAASAALTGGRRGLLLPLAVGAAGVAVVAYVSSVDPNETGHYPTCPFLALSGYYCPGCGALRAIHAIGHGDVVTALQRNPFAVLTVPFLVGVWALWVWRTGTGRQRVRVAPPWSLYLLLGAIAAFGVLRNLPGWTWLSPA